MFVSRHVEIPPNWQVSFGNEEDNQVQEDLNEDYNLKGRITKVTDDAYLIDETVEIQVLTQPVLSRIFEGVSILGASAGIATLATIGLAEAGLIVLSAGTLALMPGIGVAALLAIAVFGSIAYDMDDRSTLSMLAHVRKECNPKHGGYDYVFEHDCKNKVVSENETKSLLNIKIASIYMDMDVEDLSVTEKEDLLNKFFNDENVDAEHFNYAYSDIAPPYSIVMLENLDAEYQKLIIDYDKEIEDANAYSRKPRTDKMENAETKKNEGVEKIFAQVLEQLRDLLDFQHK